VVNRDDGGRPKRGGRRSGSSGGLAPGIALDTSVAHAGQRRQPTDSSTPAVSEDRAPPVNLLHLIDHIWTTLTWARTGQFVVILIAAGGSAALLFAGLGLLARSVFATPAAWSVLGAIVAGGGAAGSGYYLSRRRGTASTLNSVGASPAPRRSTRERRQGASRISASSTLASARVTSVARDGTKARTR
jgi:hypothetical protein